MKDDDWMATLCVGLCTMGCEDEAADSPSAVAEETGGEATEEERKTAPWGKSAL